MSIQPQMNTDRHRSELNTLQRLLSLGLPFTVHSPNSDLRVNPPSWWNGQKDDHWVLEVFDHETRSHYLGSGATLDLAAADLDEGMRKGGRSRP